MQLRQMIYKGFLLLKCDCLLSHSPLTPRSGDRLHSAIESTQPRRQFCQRQMFMEQSVSLGRREQCRQRMLHGATCMWENEGTLELSSAGGNNTLTESPQL
jgi:hypothetical protein